MYFGSVWGTYLLMGGARVVMIALVYRWLFISTPLHRLDWFGLTSGYPDLVWSLGIGAVVYGVVFLVGGATAAVIRWFGKEWFAADERRQELQEVVLDTAQMVMILLDVICLYVLQVSTSGPMSPFSSGRGVILSLAVFAVRSPLMIWGVWFVHVISYVVLYLNYPDKKAVWDIVLEVAPLSVLVVCLCVVRLGCAMPKRNV